MRLNPGLVRTVRLDRERRIRLNRVAVLPGHRVPWRPPIRIFGLLELVHLRTPATS
jgi:hypothetical protein